MYVYVYIILIALGKNPHHNFFAEFLQHSFPRSSSLVQRFMSETRRMLEKRNHKMKQCYANTVFDIFNSCKFRCQYGIINQVADAIKEYLSKVSNTDIRIESAKEISLIDLQATVLRHSSWFNYDLLEFVTDKFGGKDLLRKYLQGPLYYYQQLPIMEIPPKSYDYKGSSETHERQLCYLLPSAYNTVVTTGQDLRHIVTSLRQKLELPSLILIGHEAGGTAWTELYFGIPNKDDLQSQSSPFSYYTEWSEECQMYCIKGDIL